MELRVQGPGILEIMFRLALLGMIYLSNLRSIRWENGYELGRNAAQVYCQVRSILRNTDLLRYR